MKISPANVSHIKTVLSRILFIVYASALDAVGKPVARLPPHRSLHEVFPHKAPRSGSLPCQAILRISVTHSLW